MTSSRERIAKVLAQPHRANPATANCAMWLSPEQLAERAKLGRKVVGTVPCPCGNHDRIMYA